jgi:hypothetical protein
VGAIPAILVENAFARLVPAPFLGVGAAGALQGAPGTIYWVALLGALFAVAAIAIRQARRDADGTAVLLLGYWCAIGMLGLVAITRSYNIPILQRPTPSLLPAVRYSFLPAALATLLWTSWLLHWQPVRAAARAVRVGALAVIAAQLVTEFPRRHARPDLDWPRRAAVLQQRLDAGRTQDVPVLVTMRDLAIHPVGWVPDNRRVAVLVPAPSASPTRP